MHTSASYRHLRRFFSGTLLCRVTGMMRDLVTVFVFGASPSVGAFLVAFRLSNLMRRLLGEGPFQAAFIPHYEHLRAEGREKEFFRRLASIMFFVLLGFVIGGEVLIRGLSSLSFFSPTAHEILSLTRLLLPGMLFICLYGLNISLHQSHHSFFIPSFSPAICNLVWVGTVLVLRGQEASTAMPTLAKLVLVGYVLQWLVTLPLPLKVCSLRGWLRFSISQDTKKFFRFVSLTIIGVGAVQINTFFDSMFAVSADPRGVTYLWNSVRLEQFVLALFGLGAVNTIVPKLTKAIKSGSHVEAASIFSFSVRRLLLIMIPATFATLVLGRSAVNLLYGHGCFTPTDVMQTYYCLFAYGLGLIPTALILLYSALFYAMSRPLFPSLLAVGMVGLNIALNSFFVFGLQLGCISVAIATTICAWVNAMILHRRLAKEGFQVEGMQIGPLVLVSSVATLSVLALPAIASKGGAFLTQAAAFSLSTIVFSQLFNCRELFFFILDFLHLRRMFDKNPSESR